MDLSLTDDQRMLVDSLNRFLGDHYDFAKRQIAAESDEGFSRETWRQLAELGMLGALFDSDAGGFAGGGFDLAVMFEAFGRALTVEPFVGVLMAGTILAKAGSQPDALENLVAGNQIAMLAHQEWRSRYAVATGIETTAVRRDDGWCLTGTKTVVPQVEAADFLLVSAVTAPDAEPSLFLVPATSPGLTIHGYGLIDGGRGGDVHLDQVAVGSDALVGGEGGGAALIEAAQDSGIVALCAEAVGIMDVLKEATAEYLRTRASSRRFSTEWRPC